MIVHIEGLAAIHDDSLDSEFSDQMNHNHHHHHRHHSNSASQRSHSESRSSDYNSSVNDNTPVHNHNDNQLPQLTQQRGSIQNLQTRQAQSQPKRNSILLEASKQTQEQARLIAEMNIKKKKREFSIEPRVTQRKRATWAATGKDKKERALSLMKGYCWFEGDENDHSIGMRRMYQDSLVEWKRFENSGILEPSKMKLKEKANTGASIAVPRQSLMLNIGKGKGVSLKELSRIRTDQERGREERDAATTTATGGGASTMNTMRVRRKSCECVMCGKLNTKQAKMIDLPFIPVQQKKYFDIKYRIKNILATPIRPVAGSQQQLQQQERLKTIAPSTPKHSMSMSHTGFSPSRKPTFYPMEASSTKKSTILISRQQQQTESMVEVYKSQTNTSTPQAQPPVTSLETIEQTRSKQPSMSFRRNSDDPKDENFDSLAESVSLQAIDTIEDQYMSSTQPHESESVSSNLKHRMVKPSPVRTSLHLLKIDRLLQRSVEDKHHRVQQVPASFLHPINTATPIKLTNQTNNYIDIFSAPKPSPSFHHRKTASLLPSDSSSSFTSTMKPSPYLIQPQQQQQQNQQQLYRESLIQFRDRYMNSFNPNPTKSVAKTLTNNTNNSSRTLLSHRNNNSTSFSNHSLSTLSDPSKVFALTRKAPMKSKMAIPQIASAEQLFDSIHNKKHAYQRVFVDTSIDKESPPQKKQLIRRHVSTTDLNLMIPHPPISQTDSSDKKQPAKFHCYFQSGHNQSKLTTEKMFPVVQQSTTTKSALTTGHKFFTKPNKKQYQNSSSTTNSTNSSSRKITPFHVATTATQI